ncbi:MAG: fatty acyl-AMP ligase [Prochloraceae cyanobacterium]
MRNYSTLITLLRDRANERPDDKVYTFLTDPKTASGSLTYQELETRSRAIAAQLQYLNAAGDRALVVYPYTGGIEFITAFFGCLYANLVAVTSNAPKNAASLAKLERRAIDSKATVGLTTKELLDKFKYLQDRNPQLAPQLKQIKWIATDTIDNSFASSWIEPHINGDNLAFLQYTSGSTGIPKGVMVTHQNILQNSETIARTFQHTKNSKGAIWLPLYHDMGLIGGVIQPIYVGFPVLLMSPISLIQNPLIWLEIISHHRATTSGGPNFAYDFVCRDVNPDRLANLDLSSWDVAFCGAEPVLERTLEKFYQTFAAVGFRFEAFYPCYGMAEATLFITGGLKSAAVQVKYLDSFALSENKVVEAEDKTKARAIVSCGQVWLDGKVAIVDPDTLTECSADRVGEIWFSGSGVGKGYWNQPQKTEDTFSAYIHPTKEGPFLRTGDLGFIADGELFITGRLKDVMILWGRYQYPQYIEQTIEKCHPALRSNCSAVFSISVAEEECLVAAVEIERTYLRNLNPSEIITAIYRAVLEEHTIEVRAIALLKTGTIPKTSSGKIQRSSCKEMFLTDKLDLVGRWQNF